MSFITCVGLLRLLGGIDNAYERIICSLYHFVHIIIIIIILVGTKKNVDFNLIPNQKFTLANEKKTGSKAKDLITKSRRQMCLYKENWSMIFFFFLHEIKS